MDKEVENHQENSNKVDDLSPKNKQQNNYNNTSDRLKRDEWSEGAVSCLLEAYETKWILRNRAKLKGQDWEDVAKHVSARASSTKSPKTQTQCKNKIESMKKRYRSESATGADASSWPLYSRLDLLLRGNNNASSSIVTPPVAVAPVVEPPQPAYVQPPPLPPVHVPPPLPPDKMGMDLPVGNGGGQNSHGSNGDVNRGVKEDIMDAKLSDNASDKNAMDTNSSTPALYSDDKSKSKNVKLRMQDRKLKKRKRDGWEVAESIRLLAEVVVRSEQARLETMKEIERMRAEAEAKRGEMDLKRTEIIANTQLEIAKLFASISSKGVDSSLRIGRS